jgi:biotin operon repressor
MGRLRSLRIVERWLARFVADEEGLEDLPRSGRPLSDESIALITQLLADDTYLSQKTIATSLSISQTTMKSICLKSCRSERLILNGFLIDSVTNKSRKEFHFQLSSCNYWKHEGHVRLRMYTREMKHGFAMKICPLQCGWAWTWSQQLVCDYRFERKS